MRRGQRSPAGTRLFLIEPDQQVAQGQQAAAELAAAHAQAEDARKGQRPAELADPRSRPRRRRGGGARGADRAQPRRRAGPARHLRPGPARRGARRLSERRRPARRRRSGGSRSATLGAARATSPRRRRAGGAGRRRASPRPARGSRHLSPIAPSAGRIEEVFYQRGEWAAANQPIVALIPDDRIYVRFFVPERAVAAYRPGRRVRFRCDGCAEGLAATITYVSPRPEFTPPVIYSREARDRLVFMVEARPDNGARARPGPAGRRLPIGAGRDRRDRRRGPQQVVRRPARGARTSRSRSRRAGSPASSAPTARARPRRLRMLCGLLTPDSGTRHRAGLRHHRREPGDQAPHRLHDPELLALRGPDRRGEPPVQRPHPRPRPAPRAGRRRAGRSSASPSGAGSSPARCRAAGSSGSRSPPRPCTSRSCCCSTSRPPASIRRRGATSGTRSMRSPPRA